MTTARIHTGDLVWNTAMTFGVAIVSGGTTWSVKKLAHRYFGNENILLTHIGACIAGVAVAYGLSSRATVMTFPFDERFRRFHSLHVLFTFVFDGLAAMMFYENKADKAVILGSVGTLFALTFLTGIHQVGRAILPCAGIMGVIAALYPYEKG
jgi:hypothetical protein